MTARQVEAMLAEVHQVVLRHVDAAADALASGAADPAEARFVRLLVRAARRAVPLMAGGA